MTEKEYLLTVLIEECSEVQHAATKALRHGINACYPGTYVTNGDDIIKELAHVKALMEMLQDKSWLDLIDEYEVDEKKFRINEWLDKYKKEEMRVTNEQRFN